VPANVLADRFLHVMLYITVLSSFMVFIEPAPYEYLALLLGFACVLARVSLSRFVLPLFVLLLIRDGSGVVGLLQIVASGWMRLSGEPDATIITFDYPDSIRFLATSFYLGLTAVLFACICAEDTMRRMKTLRAAYITAAVIASILGTIGYFQLIPGFDLAFTDGSRATGGFKGPNDLGAYLIAPLMWLFEGVMIDRIRLRSVLATGMISVALLLTFSRGAWGSVIVCTAVLTYLIFITQNDPKVRRRIVLFIGLGVAAVVVLLLLLSSIDAVSHMISERTQLQDYDVNADNRSRFRLQADSLHEMFNYPFGMGPWGFAHATNWVSHNTFLGTALNHGWIGGAAYLALIVLTLVIGFRALWIRTPWQTLLIATYVSFLAMVFEGVWGDTDHWRHFYVLLGITWGLVAATQKWLWRDWQQLPRAARVIKPGVLPSQQIAEHTG
jgi:hypothetical protein